MVWNPTVPPAPRYHYYRLWDGRLDEPVVRAPVLPVEDAVGSVLVEAVRAVTGEAGRRVYALGYRSGGPVTLVGLGDAPY